MNDYSASFGDLTAFCFFFSFDILGDKLGLNRTEFPHTLYMVAGTQVSFVLFYIFICICAFRILFLSC